MESNFAKDGYEIGCDNAKEIAQNQFCFQSE